MLEGECLGCLSLRCSIRYGPGRAPKRNPLDDTNPERLGSGFVWRRNRCGAAATGNVREFVPVTSVTVALSMLGRGRCDSSAGSSTATTSITFLLTPFGLAMCFLVIPGPSTIHADGRTLSLPSVCLHFGLRWSTGYVYLITFPSMCPSLDIVKWYAIGLSGKCLRDLGSSRADRKMPRRSGFLSRYLWCSLGVRQSWSRSGPRLAGTPTGRLPGAPVRGQYPSRVPRRGSQWCSGRGRG